MAEIKLAFPHKGLHKNFAKSDQPAQTSPSLVNVRPSDVSEHRIRGGQRPALVKAFATQVGYQATHTPTVQPVAAICQITMVELI